MKDKKLDPVSLIITGVALLILVLLLIQAAHTQRPFVPTPPPVANSGSLSDIPSGASAAPSSTTPQSTSVCYAVNNPTTGSASLQVTTSDGQNATGSLSESLPNQTPLNGSLTGTLTGSSDGASVVFTGQYVDAMSIGNSTPETFTITQTQAQLGSLTLARVDCTQ